jgi:ComEC/Rec2-related protein
MKRPLVPVAICYAAGVLLADYLHPPVLMIFVWALTIASAACMLPARRPVLLLLLTFAAGWVNLAWRTDLRSPSDLRNFFSPDPIIVTLRGTLSWSPEKRVTTYGEREVARTLAWLNAREVTAKGGAWHPAGGKVLIASPGLLQPEVRKGAEVEVTGVLAAPPGPEAEGLFDYQKYLARQDIHFQLRTAGAEDWKVIRPVQRSVSESFMEWAKRALSRGVEDKGLPVLLLHSMTLGARSSLEQDDYEPFIRTGTMHLFAISGLHVALISGMLLWVLRMARVPRSWCGVIALPLIWFYTAATGWQPSAARATIMMSVVILGWSLERPTDLINSLCAAGLMILLYEPRQLFGASFQLSFFVVLSIALLLPVIERQRDAWLRHDPLLPAELVPRWRRLMYRPLRSTTSALGISLAAWLGAMPLTIYYFHLFTPVTLLANIVAVPLSSIALGCNMASLVFGDWLPLATGLLNRLAVIAMAAIVWLCEWSGQLPFAAINVRPLTIMEVAVYYALLMGIFSGWLLAEKRRAWFFSLSPIALLAWWLLPGSAVPGLTVFPLEGGLAIHSSWRGEEVLIDCGKTNSVERLVMPWLQARGINNLDGFVLTHGDMAHVGGASLVAARFQPDVVYAGPLKFRSPVYKRCIEEFASANRLRVVSVGSNAGRWRVLHPMPDDPVSRADQGSLVLATEFNGTRVLLLSDLDRTGQEMLLTRGIGLRADIVVTGLPDQGEPLCDALLERIKPELVIVADSSSPSYAKAKPALLERLRAKGCHVTCTSDTGVATIRFERSGHHTLNTMRPQPASP